MVSVLGSTSMEDAKPANLRLASSGSPQLNGDGIGIGGAPAYRETSWLILPRKPPAA